MAISKSSPRTNRQRGLFFEVVAGKAHAHPLMGSQVVSWRLSLRFATSGITFVSTDSPRYEYGSQAAAETSIETHKDAVILGVLSETRTSLLVGSGGIALNPSGLSQEEVRKLLQEALDNLK